jgi:acylpyruvate hydrolase
VVVGDEVTAGLEQDGKELATLTHTMIAREGGYAFNPDL